MGPPVLSADWARFASVSGSRLALADPVARASPSCHVTSSISIYHISAARLRSSAMAVRQELIADMELANVPRLPSVISL